MVEISFETFFGLLHAIIRIATKARIRQIVFFMIFGFAYIKVTPCISESQLLGLSFNILITLEFQRPWHT
jgi:hypothetical protein